VKLTRFAMMLAIVCSLIGGAVAQTTVYKHTTTGQTSVSGKYSTVYTTTAAGLYRVSADLYPTTNNPLQWVVEISAQATQVSAAQATQRELAAVNIDAGLPIDGPFSALLNLGSGAAIQIATATQQGAADGGVYTYSVTIEKL
jgi:hypothetical protein